MLLKHLKRWTNSQGSTIIQNKIYFFGKDLETSFCLLRLGRGRFNDTL